MRDIEIIKNRRDELLAMRAEILSKKIKLQAQRAWKDISNDEQVLLVSMVNGATGLLQQANALEFALNEDSEMLDPLRRYKELTQYDENE